MKVIPIDSQTLNHFVSLHPYAHHMKTACWGEFLNNRTTRTHYLGFYEDELIATAMVIERRTCGHKYWYIPFGPCVDYQNPVLIERVLTTLKEYSQRQRVFFIRLDPNQERCEHNQKGDVVSDGFHHENITQIMETCGYHHLGYNYGYAGNWQPRFTYILNIDQPIDQLISNSYKENQTYYNKNLKRAITVRCGEMADLEYLETFGRKLAEKLGFEWKKKEYYQKIIKHYPDNHLFLIAEADLVKAEENIRSEINALTLQIEQLEGKIRNVGRIKEITREINNLENEVNQIREWRVKEGNNIVLAAGLFVYAGDISFDLYLYSNKGLTNFRAPISLHYKAMELLQQRGIKRYDFVGISGSLDHNDPYYGLYDFKRRFNGRFIEYLGEFDLVHRPLIYKLFLSAYKVKRRIERKITRMRNQKQ